MAAGLPLRKTVFTPPCKSVLLPFELSAAISATDAAIQKKFCVSGTTSLTVSSEKMEDIMKIIKTLGESALIIK